MADQGKDARPMGSGVFAIVWGVLFAVAGGSAFLVHVDQIKPGLVMGVWCFLVALILVLWGGTRVHKSKAEGDMTIGQETISFVMTLVTATIALLGLFLKS